MKHLNKQILESIKKGINLAIDDLDDLDNTLEILKKARIKNDIHAKDLLPFVDLGLSSRTLWYKYNVGVDPGLLEIAEDWYGNYYTFDEASDLDEYIIPTKEQILELIDETKSEWIENYKGIEGLNGRVFVGKNGNSVFMPAAGWHSGSSLFSVGDACDCWSSSLYLSVPSYGYSLSFNSSNFSLYTDRREDGFSARPVLNR